MLLTSRIGYYNNVVGRIWLENISRVFHELGGGNKYIRRGRDKPSICGVGVSSRAVCVHVLSYNIPISTAHTQGRDWLLSCGAQVLDYFKLRKVIILPASDNDNCQ